MLMLFNLAGFILLTSLWGFVAEKLNDQASERFSVLRDIQEDPWTDDDLSHIVCWKLLHILTWELRHYAISEWVKTNGHSVWLSS